MARKRRGRGEGAIYERADGVWCSSISLGYDDCGKRRRKVIYGRTKAEVMDRLRTLQERAAKGSVPDAGNLTVGRFCDEWLAAVRPAIARGTYGTYDQHVRNRIKPKLGGVRLTKLNALHVQNFYAALARDGDSTSMQKHAGVTLRAALSWGVRMGLISDNPAKKAAMPAHRPDEVRGLEPGQAAAFLQAARSDRLYSLYVLAVDSGCRQGELLALSWRDIDFDRATVAITKSLEEVGGHQRLKEPKTVRSRRIVTISQVSLDALQEHRRAMLAEGSYGPDRPVYCGPRRGRWYRKSDLYRQSFQPILKRAGLSFKFHTLRHACASFLLTAGTDIKTVQERLGHSTATMTLNTYSHVLSGAQAEAARRLQVILTSATASAAAGA